MNRVSSAMIPLSSMADLAKAQQQLLEASRQSSAQTKSSDLKGYGREAQTLVSAERLMARTDGYSATSRELTTRMQIQDVSLGRTADVISKLKEDLFQNVGLESGEGVRSQLQETFAVLKDAMNTNLGGRYLFGGVMNDQPPVTANNLTDLANNPLSSSLASGADPQMMRVEEGRTVQAGVVADGVVTDAMASIKRLAELDQGPNGPFSGPLTPVQKQALQDEVTQLSAAFDKILAQQSENGRLMKDVDSASTRLTNQKNALDEAIGGIVNVDLAEVAVRLNQAQFAYNSSASVFNTVRQLSLLNVLK